MNQEKDFKEKASDFFEKKGFYVVLAVCLAVVGVTTFFTFGGIEEKNQPPVPVEVRQSTDQTLQAVATAPPIMQVIPPQQVVMPTPLPLATAVPTAQTAQKSTARTSKKQLFDSPVVGEVVLPYASNSLVYSKTLNQWTSHSGIDIAGTDGTKVTAVAKGVVDKVVFDELMGNMVVIKHDDMTTTYASLSELPDIKAGSAIKKGDIIGVVGISAINECLEPPHVHFEMRMADKLVDPKEHLIGVTKLAD